MCCQAGDRPQGEGRGRARPCGFAGPRCSGLRLPWRRRTSQVAAAGCRCASPCSSAAALRSSRLPAVHPATILIRVLAPPGSASPSGLPARPSVRNSVRWEGHSCESRPASAVQFRRSPWTGSQQNVARTGPALRMPPAASGSPPPPGPPPALPAPGLLPAAGEFLMFPFI